MSHYFPESYMWSHAMLLVLGTIPWGGGEIGEIDLVGQRLKTRVGENDAWYEEWHGRAGRIESLAVQAAQAGHGVTARETFLRACNYYHYYHLAERFLMIEFCPLAGKQKPKGKREAGRQGGQKGVRRNTRQQKQQGARQRRKGTRRAKEVSYDRAQ